MHPILKKFLKYGIFLGLGFFLTYWQYNSMTEEDKAFFVKSIKEAAYVYIVPIVVLALLSHLSRAIRWRYLMEPMGYQPLLNNTFATVMIGYLVNTLAPRAGEVAKCTLLSKKEKIPFEKLLGTILIERAIDLFCYFLVIIITILLQYEKIKGLILSIYQKAIEKGGMHPLLKMSLYVILVFVLFFFVKWLIKKYRNINFFKKFENVLSGIKDGFQSIKKLKRKKLFWAHTLLIWSCYLLQIYIGFRAMSFTSHLGFDAAFAVLSLGTLAMILTPGGIGSFPIAVAQVLVVYNISNAAAESFGWVIWGVSTSIIVITGIVCYIWFEVKKQKTHVHNAIR